MARRKPSQLNCLIAVDKPVGCTSHDVVARVRRAVGERRVGHAGTLDPLASGVMVVGIGQATRLLGRITQDTKSYIADIAFGAETNTDDAEGEVVRTAPVGDAVRDTASASELLTSMLGDQMQVPPAFSAISVDGVRSYRRARAGEEVELPARPVHVFAADLIAVSDIDGAPVWTVAFTVSKGTYIRALARDIGRASGSAAHIASLRRTASGIVTLSGCVALDALSPSLVPDDMLDPIGVLDVTISSNLILDKILGIKDLRSDKRIDFVGGIRGLGELKRRVDSGEMKVALALYPVTMKQIMDIADTGNIMPPKTTWFEPKLRSGLIIHKLS